MNKIRSSFMLWFLVFYQCVSHTTFGQGDRIIRINEIMPLNQSNIVDQYGDRVPWFELYNPAYNPVDISYMYITDDSLNPTKFRVSDLGKTTRLEPRSFIIFYADGNTEKSPLHTNFKLDSSGYLAIYDVNGRTLLDQVHYRCSVPDHSFGRMPDGSDDFQLINKPTPGTKNDAIIHETSAETFIRIDPTGTLLTIISMFVVFSALFMIFILYKIFDVIARRGLKIPVPHHRKKQDTEEIFSGEMAAAIAAALYFYQSVLHDIENTKITIKKVSRTYSPWSSKIYGLRKHPKNW